MWESSALLGALTPKFYVALTGTSSLISGLILIFEWWYFRKYGASFIEQVSLTHLGPWLGTSSSANAAASPSGINEGETGECKVWRNPMCLFRGAEYARLWAARRRAPLTYYDMNLSAQEHQAWLGAGASGGDAVDEAMSRAWREREPAARVAAARQALALRPEYAPALLLLAEEDAPTVVEAERLLKRALCAAEAACRSAAAGTAEARRCAGVLALVRRRLAGCARRLGRLREAARAYRELARDPHPATAAHSPHEGLVEVLLEMGAYADLQGVLARYEEGGASTRSATLLYTTALLRARAAAAAPPAGKHAADLAASEAMRAAVEYNPWVGEYLLERRALTLPPEHVVRRGQSEAVAYAFAHLPHWRRHEPALRLLAGHHQGNVGSGCLGGGAGGCPACADRQLLGAGRGRRAPALLPAGAALCAGTAALALLAHRWPDHLHVSAIHTLLSAL